ncbi:MAG: type II toxin-antitoxin system PemK/MazF family toxin [Deltaproteobacteria bacterium]|nr:MAG: type II toxin-antitoxin system PemK/MazF family toxin [Deltaproteobacteria bacterium]
MKVRRGEIWWADLGEPMGSEPSLRRPVLIVQDNQYNRSRIATVIVLSITSNTKLADMPGNILLGREESGLPKDSVINVSQIATVDKSWLEEKVGSVSRILMEEVDYGLGLVLGLN